MKKIFFSLVLTVAIIAAFTFETYANNCTESTMFSVWSTTGFVPYANRHFNIYEYADYGFTEVINHWQVQSSASGGVTFYPPNCGCFEIVPVNKAPTVYYWEVVEIVEGFPESVLTANACFYLGDYPQTRLYSGQRVAF